jgi:primary-amine oxidase
MADFFLLGSDGINDARRQFQCFLYIQDPEGQNPDSNHYAFPLPVSPVVDVQTMTVTRIESLPTGSGNAVSAPKPYKVPPPAEYVPECQPSLRTDLKPLQVVQPEGVSFQVSEEVPGGAVLDWQKWNFRIGFNHREGIVLYNVKYDGRSLFWRVSLSDMNIPYADPRTPYHKKAAFDLGDAVSFPSILGHGLSLGEWFPRLKCADGGK